MADVQRVKALRARFPAQGRQGGSHVTVLDCVEALEATDGDVDAAATYLRQVKGVVRA